MVKILFELDDEEDKIVNSIKAINNLDNKKQAIRKIIRNFGKRIKIEFKD